MEPVQAALEPVQAGLEPIQAYFEPVSENLEPVLAGLEPVEEVGTEFSSSSQPVDTVGEAGPGGHDAGTGADPVQEAREYFQTDTGYGPSAGHVLDTKEYVYFVPNTDKEGLVRVDTEDFSPSDPDENLGRSIPETSDNYPHLYTQAPETSDHEQVQETYRADLPDPKGVSFKTEIIHDVPDPYHMSSQNPSIHFGTVFEGSDYYSRVLQEQLDTAAGLTALQPGYQDYQQSGERNSGEQEGGSLEWSGVRNSGKAEVGNSVWSGARNSGESEGGNSVWSGESNSGEPEGGNSVWSGVRNSLRSGVSASERRIQDLTMDLLQNHILNDDPQATGYKDVSQTAGFYQDGYYRDPSGQNSDSEYYSNLIRDSKIIQNLTPIQDPKIIPYPNIIRDPSMPPATLEDVVSYPDIQPSSPGSRDARGILSERRVSGTVGGSLGYPVIRSVH